MAQRTKIELTDREEMLLNKLVNMKKIFHHLEMRIRIILMSAKKSTYHDIKEKLGCSEPVISYWKQRWANNYEKLTIFSKGIEDKGVTDNKLIKEIMVILGDAPRCGAPVTFTDEIQKKIQAIACEKPDKYGLPITHWTHKELARQVISQEIVDKISSRHIGRILKKTV